ncbi:cytochrome P450 3A43-like [Centruroides sculpturatus]|uniref:cytochrome P450 3A43-like n=1 Tax=Centruroides sculpturatus TaxID=218467 RepID=UPI000C6E8DB9|nr:cytochrome P450 3A43-like [Centruroides sculpturatus]
MWNDLAEDTKIMGVYGKRIVIAGIFCIHCIGYPFYVSHCRLVLKYTTGSVDIQYSDLINFQLLDQVISETLRLSPFPIVSVNRVCAEDYRYKNITIPKGCTIAIPIQVLQNDPAYWIEPDKFNPYRFSFEEQQKIDSVIYQPFGAGQRICIAQRLAKTIMKLVLANLIRSFKLEEYRDDENNREHTQLFTYTINRIMVKATPSDT